MRIPFLARRISKAEADDPLAAFASEGPKSTKNGVLKLIGVAASVGTASTAAALADRLAASAGVATPGEPLARPAPVPPPTPAHDEPPAQPPTLRDPFGLDTVVARRTPVAWHEAVAIVERATAVLCQAAVDADARVSAAVTDADLALILIDANGRVDIRADARTAGISVNQLARTLHTLTPADGTPVPLRLLVSKWIAAPAPAAINEFASELAYFARPEPATHVRAVYERCLALPSAPVRQELERNVRPPQSPAPQPRRPKPRWLVPVAAGIASLAAAGAVWTFSASADGSAFPSAEAAVSALGLGETATTLTERLGLTRSASQTAAASSPNNTSGDIPLVRRSMGRRAPAAIVAERAPAFVAEERQSRTPVLDLPLFTLSPPAAQRSETVPEVSASHVYSSADADVEPPQMLYPSLPPPVFEAGNNAINTMEVVVGANGDVERVRLISKAERMTDMMLLSGAKTWKFAPASRDGVPVRYRVVLSWTATP